MLESKLSFLREVGKPGCGYKLVQVKKAMDIFIALVDIPYNRKVQQTLPLTTKLTIERKDRAQVAIKLETMEASTNKQ